MKRYSVGFRIKFDAIKSEDIDQFVREYLQKFDRYEIKVTKNLVSSGKIEVLLAISEKIAKERYSLHLRKDALSNPQALDETNRWLTLLQSNEGKNAIHLVTHIPYGHFQEYGQKILMLSSQLPENCLLLLENERIDCNNEQYLWQINALCTWLEERKMENIGICLDLGHLLFGFHLQGNTMEYGLGQLGKMSQILSRIQQIHIHDYCESDHLPLQQGLMNLDEVARFIRQKKLMVPIIIETTVVQPEQDGIKQIVAIKQSLMKERQT